MAGIKYLVDIYKNQGKEFLENLLKGPVTISEKLNASTFCFEKSLDSGEIFFYKRDQVNPISKIDRTLMTYYEGPIHYIKGLSDDIKSEIPVGWRFGCEFFINNNPVALSYDNLPKNRLVLTHVLVKNGFGDHTRTIVEKKELDYWSNILEIEKAPIIFQGKLEDEHRLKLYQFLSVTYDELEINFGTNSLVKYIISIVNPSLKKSALNNDLKKPIEGIVFRFGSFDGQGESISAKVIDPVFEEIARSKKSEKTPFFPNDIYGISIIEVMNFILNIGIENFSFSGDTTEDKYLTFICDVFEKFIDTEGENYRGLDFNEPYYLKGEGFITNLPNIPSERTRNLIQEEESYESLFKLILSAFRKLKKKPGGFFTAGVIQQFNILVREISELLTSTKIPVLESNMPTFGEFRKKIKTTLFEDEDEEAEIPLESSTSSPLSQDKEDPEIADGGLDEEPLGRENIEDEDDKDEPFLQRMRDVLNKNSDHDKLDGSKEKVGLFIGEFQPFNNGHLKAIKRTYQEIKTPLIISIVEPKNQPKYFLNKDALMKIINSVMSEFPNVIRDIVICEDDLLHTTINAVSDKYQPISLTTGDKRKDGYVLQKRSLLKKGILEDGFKIYNTPEWVSSSSIRDSVEKKDFLTFSKNVPKSVSLMWEEICRNYDEMLKRTDI